MTRSAGGSYLARRLLQVFPTVAGIVLVSFALVHAAPGDPVVALAGESGDAAYYAETRARFGLDRPVTEQLLSYVANLARGDLGTSFVQGRPVASIVAERFAATLLLTGTALVVSSLLGVALGVLTARRAGKAGDVGFRSATLLGQVVPTFTVAQVLLVTLAAGTRLFPVQGMTTARADHAGFAHIADVAHHLVLPVAVLAISEAPLIARLVRSGLLEAMESAYIRTGRASGLPPRRLIRRALRNVLLPVTTVIGNRAGMLLAGAVVVEIVFAWPGLGRLLLSAVQTRDQPVLLGVFLVVSMTVVLANLVTDLAYRRLDPRITRG